jgi:integrase
MKGRNKAGSKEIHVDHIIPLSKRSIEILTMLEEQKKRDKSDSEYVFGNYRTANNTSARIGRPLCSQTVLNLVRRLVDQKDVDATLHGMRTAFRSWGGEQGRFHEADLERAIAHIRGHGETEVSRLYSRQAKQIMPLIQIFTDWEAFCLSGGHPAEVVPFKVAKSGRRYSGPRRFSPR